MRYNNTDATTSKNGFASEKTGELVDLIKATIFRDLRRKFEVDEVLEICRKIDDAARKYEEERYDAVEVVRCEKCAKSRETEDERYMFCMQFADTVHSRAFCFYGERRE